MCDEPARYDRKGETLPPHRPICSGSLETAHEARGDSPPLPIQTGSRVENPNLHLLWVWELVELNMAISEEHVESALPFVVVPDALGLRISAIRVPGPVSLYNFSRRRETKVASLDGDGCVGACRSPRVAHHVARAKRVMLPLRKVARAVTEVTILYRRPAEKIPFVVWASKRLQRLGVTIQRSIRRRYVDVESSVSPTGTDPIFDNGK